MKLTDIVRGPWAITPEMYQEVQAIYSRHLRGEKIDLNNLEAAIGRPLASEPKGYEIIDGVAVLPLDGVIGKKMNLMTKISGGVSTDLAGKEVMRAMNDPEVKGLILAVDSPGGTVDGTPDLASLVASAKDSGKKPMCAWTDGMMCSAAYWIGSAAGRVFISSEATQVGSIGVVAAHTDYSAAEAKQGLKTTEISAGKYKRIASQYGPLTEEGRAYIQDSVDYTYSVFVDAVATHRGTSAEDVLSRMADGRVFLGSQAVTNGLADGVQSLADTIEMLKKECQQPQTYSRAGAATAKKGVTTMTLDQLKADHPDLYDAAKKDGEKKCGECDQCANCDQKQQGAQAERDRINAVRAVTVPGYEALIEALAFDGKSTAADAALAIVAAQQKEAGAAAATIAAEAPPAVPAADSGDGQPGTMKRVEFNKLSVTEQRRVITSGTKLID